MVNEEDTFECETCDAVVAFEEARRTETIGDLDPTKWQTLCCPTAGIG